MERNTTNLAKRLKRKGQPGENEPKKTQENLRKPKIG